MSKTVLKAKRHRSPAFNDWRQNPPVTPSTPMSAETAPSHFHCRLLMERSYFHGVRTCGKRLQ